jgi:signal transduction histidine kinase/CheY-like chemotaxis protein
MKHRAEWIIGCIALILLGYTTYIFMVARVELERVQQNTNQLQLLGKMQLQLDSILLDITRINIASSGGFENELAVSCGQYPEFCNLKEAWLNLKSHPSSPGTLKLRNQIDQLTKDIRNNSREIAISLNIKWYQILVLAFSGCLFALIITFLLFGLRKQKEKTEKQNEHLSKLSKDLEDKNAMLREAGKEREAFSHLVSHEMKTPLNIISGMSDLMAGENQIERRRELSEEIGLATRSLARIIDNTIDYERYYKGDIEVKEEPFHLHSLCGLVYRSVGFHADQKNLKVELFIDPAIGDLLFGDGVLLSRVLMQLMSNAVKYTDTGSISLSAGLIEDFDNFQKIEFRITDSGVGIERERLDEIFESFNQKNRVFIRDTEGFGLGLSMAQTLLTAMGTRLNVHSVPMQGSQFYFVIELKKTKLRDLTDTELKKLSGIKLLIVEDNRLNLLIISKYLEKHKFEIESATTHEDAISKLLTHDYHCVLMDLQIPGKDGFEILAEIKQRRPDFKTDVLAVTAASIQFVHEKIVAHGFVDFVAKPVREQELLTKIYRTVFKDVQTD